MWLLYIGLGIAGIALLAYIANRISYSRIKKRVLNRHDWDLNICCGHTDGGGINADIVKHSDLPNFVLIDDITDLPFDDDQFERVLCSHTIEHVDDVEAFDAELRRVGRDIIYLVPPLWDFSAALNIFEHKTLFLTFRSEHHRLPPYIRLPFARLLHRKIGQKIKA